MSSDSKLILKASTDIDKEAQLIFAYLIGLQQVVNTTTSKVVESEEVISKSTNDPIDDSKPKESSETNQAPQEGVSKPAKQKVPETKVDKIY